MGIAEIIKYVNSNRSKPLNILIDEVKSGVTTITNVANAINNNTTINNAANSNGILSQKLSWIINIWNETKASYLDTTISSRQSEYNAKTRYDSIIESIIDNARSTKPSIGSSNTLIYEYTWPNGLTDSMGYYVIGKFLPPVDGVYTVYITKKNNGYAYPIDIVYPIYDYGKQLLWTNAVHGALYDATSDENSQLCCKTIFTTPSILSGKWGTQFYCRMGQPQTILAHSNEKRGLCIEKIEIYYSK